MRLLIVGLSLAAASLSGLAGLPSAPRVNVATADAAFEPAAKPSATSRAMPAAGFTVSMLEAGDVYFVGKSENTAAPDGFPAAQPFTACAGREWLFDSRERYDPG